MKELPQVKVENINLEAITEKALITTIDVFRFIHEEDSSYVTVEIGEEEHDFLDEIEISGQDLSATELELIALVWMSEHVEAKEKKTLGEELINGLEVIERDLKNSQISEQIKELEDKRSQLYTGTQEKSDVELTRGIHRQQLQLLAERSKSCPDENIFSITTAMLDVSIYLASN